MSFNERHQTDKLASANLLTRLGIVAKISFHYETNWSELRLNNDLKNKQEGV